MNTPELDLERRFLVMDGGTTALDVKEDGDYRDDPAMGLDVIPVGEDNMAHLPVRSNNTFLRS